MKLKYRFVFSIAWSLLLSIVLFFLISGLIATVDKTGLFVIEAIIAVSLALLCSFILSCIKKESERKGAGSAMSLEIWNTLFLEYQEKLLLVDPDNETITAVNKAAAKALKTCEADIIGKKCENHNIKSGGKGLPLIVPFETAELIDDAVIITQGLDLSAFSSRKSSFRQPDIVNKHIFADLPLPLFRTKMAGEMIAANEAFLTLMKISANDDLSKINFSSFFTESIEREFLMEKIRKEEIVKNIELHMKRSDGSGFDALLTAYKVQDSFGEMCIESSLIDITSIKMQEKDKRKMESLQYRNKYMDSINKLAAGIAHDINNILAGIQGHAQVIQYKLPTDDPLLKSVERINSAVERADVILNGLMTSIGAYDYKPRTIRLDSFISKVLTEAEKTMDIQGRYRIINMDGAVSISVDIALMTEAIIEIVKNAYNAMDDKEEVVITTSIEKPHDIISNFLSDSEERTACISIIDKGHGMDIETIDKIFEPYYTTRNFGTGAGLGMTKVYGIIQNHDGAIGIVNEPGKGVAVSVYLKLNLDIPQK